MTNYPNRTDIVTAMRNPSVSFKATELQGGEIIQKGSRVIQYSGGYTTVFPFINRDGNKVAVRCWIADIGEAKRRSQEISSYLSQLASLYFVDFKYIDNALLVNGSLYPVVVMDWVQAKTLKSYINDHIHQPVRLVELANRFKDMVAYFHEQDVAHGDLQHGNILVKDDGSLVVIDYDSMYIEPLDGMLDIIKGLPGYQHPNRNLNKLISPKLDYFSELIIYLSLLVYAHEPHLWSIYYETEDLLFSKEDFTSPNQSKLIAKLNSSSNNQIFELAQKLKECLQKKDISELQPLEELLVNKLEMAKASIFDKWDEQPNSPAIRSTQLPNLNTILNKF